MGRIINFKEILLKGKSCLKIVILSRLRKISLPKGINYSSNLGELSSEYQDILSILQNRSGFLASKSLNPFHFSPVLHLYFLMFSGDIAMHHWAEMG